eukprot:TRINITY_DN1668_c0_g1_i3.p1 TRINITY_DN1668_c0_g1~~TRINITY_DN1668_c0_g1_i3.p1  ORF type:complete len:372 (+),score=54.12 TRINITY_DN1668_c0_g1_i3:231-1346(+)
MNSYPNDYDVVEKWNKIKPTTLRRAFMLLYYVVDHIVFLCWFVSFKLFPMIYVYIRERNTIHRDIPYSTVRKCCLLDIYPPKNTNDTNKRYPVMVFVPGGAWKTHQKSHSITFANNLRSYGIVVVVINYTRYSDGLIEHMVEDVDLSLQWVEKNIEKYQGDAKNVFLVGYSAGAHISSLYLCNRALGIDINGEQIKPNSNKSFPHIKGFIGLAGAYHIADHYLHETKRGLEGFSPMKPTMSGIENFGLHSPLLKARKMELTPQTSSLFCNVYLMHGSSDLTVPTSSSIKFFNELKSKGFPVEYLEYKNFSHLDPVLSIMGGCKKEEEKRYLNDLKKIIYGEWVFSQEDKTNRTPNSNNNLNNRKPNKVSLN